MKSQPNGPHLDRIATSIAFQKAEIPNYWQYAQQFGLSDNFFSSIAASSSPNHVAAVAAQTGGTLIIPSHDDDPDLPSVGTNPTIGTDN